MGSTYSTAGSGDSVSNGGALDIVLKALGLTKTEINLLYETFLKLDTLQTGELNFHLMFINLGMEYSPIEKEIFSLFDEDKKGSFDFLEFACSLWNFLTLSKNILGSIAYLIQDRTGIGAISFEEIRIIIQIIHKKNLDHDAMLQKIYNKMKTDNVTSLEVLSKKKFTKWMQQNPILLQPLTKFQRKLKLKIVNVKFWDFLTKRRRDRGPDWENILPIIRLKNSIIEDYQLKLTTKNHVDPISMKENEKKSTIVGSGLVGYIRQNIVSLFLPKIITQQQSINMVKDMKPSIQRQGPFFWLRKNNNRIYQISTSKDEYESSRQHHHLASISEDSAIVALRKLALGLDEVSSRRRSLMGQEDNTSPTATLYDMKVFNIHEEESIKPNAHDIINDQDTVQSEDSVIEEASDDNHPIDDSQLMTKDIEDFFVGIKFNERPKHYLPPLPNKLLTLNRVDDHPTIIPHRIVSFDAELFDPASNKQLVEINSNALNPSIRVNKSHRKDIKRIYNDFYTAKYNIPMTNSPSFQVDRVPSPSTLQNYQQISSIHSKKTSKTDNKMQSKVSKHHRRRQRHTIA